MVFGAPRRTLRPDAKARPPPSEPCEAGQSGVRRHPLIVQSLSPGELLYCAAVLLFTFGLRGSIGFGGSIGLPLLALALPVKVLAPAWSLVGIVSSLAIIGKDRKFVDRKALVGLLPGC